MTDRNSNDVERNREWSRAVAAQYDLDEHAAMAAWLDTNLSLNQARLESVTNRLGLVLAACGALASILATAATKDAWFLTVIAGVFLAVGAVVATLGLLTKWRDAQDPTTTWSTMWERRSDGEVHAWLYRSRSDLYKDQVSAIEQRADALRQSSWVSGVAGIATVVSILVSRVY
jgi:hypothetical protein